MSPRDDHDAIQDAFAGALELPPEARAAYLAEACVGRPAMRAEVESLLNSHDRAGDFLATDRFPEQTAERPGLPARGPGHLVGGFRLLQQIGAGGMGTVFLAERAAGGFDQRVAVKLIGTAAWSADARRRFQSERQILASLQHPHIVALLDAGLTDDGEAYLVMEYVDGAAIVEHCRSRALDRGARLRLMCQVCLAVQHAHQHSVVHRDLKPANILVTPDGVPKVLDFGVAKLVASPESAPGTTATGLLGPMTPNYASPEQLRGLPATTASDVYSLGVILYELLAGVRPYDTAGLPFDQVLALVTGDRVVAPSRLAPAIDRRALQGDLDAIVTKAMSLEPERRYASARELADDVERHLSGQAVLACPPTLGYQARRLARRHRAAAIAAVISVAALTAALGVSVRQTALVRAQRNLAQQRFDDVRRLANSLIFDIHNAVAPLQGSTPARQKIVTEALTYLERLRADAADDPSLRLELARGYARIAAVQGLPSEPNLGDRQGSIANFEKAVNLLDGLAWPPDTAGAVALELGRIRLQLASTAAAAGDRDKADQALSAAAHTAERAVAETPGADEAWRLLGSVYFQQALFAPPDEAVAAWIRAAEVFDRLLQSRPDDADRQRNVALVAKYLGGSYEAVGNYTQAFEQYRLAYDIDRRRLEGAPDARWVQLDVAIDLSNLGHVAAQDGDYTEAARRYEESLAIRRRIADQDPSDDQARSRVAFALSRLGDVYSHLSRHAEAQAKIREALGILDRVVLPPGDFNRAEFLMLYGGAFSRAGQGDEACRAWRQSADAIATASPAGPPAPNSRLAIVAGELAPLIATCDPR